MITINEKRYKTLADAATHLKVSAKTVREWITKHIISKPPTMPYGTRDMDIFPDEYLNKAKEEVSQFRKERKKKLKKKK